jgi:methylated-DNA-[protein]-cysteine S-methyltransferase
VVLRAATLNVDSPFGALTVTDEAGEIVRLRWGGEAGGTSDSPVLEEAARQLAAYCAGERTAFDLPLRFADGLHGAFGRALVAIPFGETRTYGDLAKDLGVSAQAVGQCCAANRIPILIPCHRVLSASGLGGFSGAGGVETKVALLRHEGAASLLL